MKMMFVCLSAWHHGFMPSMAEIKVNNTKVKQTFWNESEDGKIRKVMEKSWFFISKCIDNFSLRLNESNSVLKEIHF